MIDEINDPFSEFLDDGHLHLEVQLEVHRDERIRYKKPSMDDLNADSDAGESDDEGGAMSSLTAGVQGASLEQAELMALAKEDISSVLKKLSKGRDADVQKMQEDRIVKARLQQRK
eukprot:gene24584-30950_t